MKQFKITAILLLFSIFSFAQIDIKSEIISFTDSTEIMIRNGRKLVIDKTIKGDRETAIQTIDYLLENIDDEYLIFYPAEEIILSIANSDFDHFLYTAKNFDTLLEGKTKRVGLDNVTGPVYQFITQEMVLIRKDLENSGLNNEDKELIKIYLKYYEGDDKLVLNKEIKNYKKNYPNTAYEGFLDELDISTQTAFMNLCMGYGREFLNGNISNSFDTDFQVMNMELEWLTNKYYYSIFMYGSVGELRSKHDIPVMKFNYIHSPMDETFSIKFGAKFGKSWITNNTINLFSYVSMGGYQMKSEKANFDIPDSESANLKLTSSFFTGIGTACDISIKTFKNNITQEKAGSWFIRPNIGYDLFLTNKENAKGGSFFINLSMGIGFGG